MKTKTFNRTKLATSLSLILSASALNVAYAAEEVSATEQDVEVIDLLLSFYKRIGIKKLNVMINSLGNETERLEFRDQLIKYLMGHVALLSLKHVIACWYRWRYYTRCYQTQSLDEHTTLIQIKITIIYYKAAI